MAKAKKISIEQEDALNRVWQFVDKDMPQDSYAITLREKRAGAIFDLFYGENNKN